MARNLNMATFVATVAAALVMNSVVAAATTYNVGDGLGWAIPPGGSVAYTTWAANKTFSVGDILVFTFATGGHDVAHVTKEAFDACNGTSPISLETNGPANITLTSTGEQYYICAISGHCDRGQKLTINVTGASSPAPQPSTPSPSKAPEATPTLAPEPSSSTPATPPPSGDTTPPPSGDTTPPPPAAPTPGSTPTTPSTPPPTPSAATSLGVAGLSATFFSIAFAFLY